MKQLLLSMAFIIGIMNVSFAQKSNYWSAGLGFAHFPSINSKYLANDFNADLPISLSYTFRKLSLVGTINIDYYSYKIESGTQIYPTQEKIFASNNLNSALLFGLNYKLGNRKWQPFLEAGFGLSTFVFRSSNYEYFDGKKEKYQSFVNRFNKNFSPYLYLNMGAQWFITEKYALQFQLKICNNGTYYYFEKLPFDYGFGLNLLRHF